MCGRCRSSSRVAPAARDGDRSAPAATRTHAPSAQRRDEGAGRSPARRPRAVPRHRTRTGTLQRRGAGRCGVARQQARKLLGGLTAADTSRADISSPPRTDRPPGCASTAVHDTAAVRLGGVASTSSAAARTAARRATRSSASTRGRRRRDGRRTAAGAELGPGGRRDRRHRVHRRRLHRHALARHDRRVAARLGAARVVARLPLTAALRRRDRGGRAARDRRRLARERRRQRRRARRTRPRPAASSGSAGCPRRRRTPPPPRSARVAYVIGGRGATLGTPTARIVAIDPRTARSVRAAGSLARRARTSRAVDARRPDPARRRPRRAGTGRALSELDRAASRPRAAARRAATASRDERLRRTTARTC